MDGILELNVPFGEFVPVRKFESVGQPYREVYEAGYAKGEEVLLVVYDYAETPDYMKVDNDGTPSVREAMLAGRLVSRVFPSYIAQGHETVGDKEIVWFATMYVDGETLDRFLRNDGPMNPPEISALFRDIMVGVNELSGLLDNGGHYNICPDNLIVSVDKENRKHVYLVGLECASECANGRPLFEQAFLDHNYRAPETFLGRYSIQSDVFSLGLILAFMYLGGELPWKKVVPDGLSYRQVIAAIKAVRRSAPDLDRIPLRVGRVVRKALSPDLNKRFKSIPIFWKAYVVAEYGSTRSTELNGTDSDECWEPAAPSEAGRSMLTASESSGAFMPLAVDTSAKAEIKKIRGKGFNAVAGMDDLKRMLTRNFISILRNKELAQKFRIVPPNGVLLFGPPGCGKTFIAERSAEEAGVNFSMVKPSDIGSIYLHGSQNMISDIFSRAEKKAPVILCFDEFDAMVPSRTNGDQANSQANEVNEFLVQLNNCAERGIYVMAMTNRPDMIDRAVLRKGRIDEFIYVPLPDLEARKGIFSIELDGRMCDSGIDCSRLAGMTEGYTSSDIAYIVQEAARSSFEDCLLDGCPEVSGISQEKLEETIRATAPSVSAEERRKYEQMRLHIAGRLPAGQRKIGFMMGQGLVDAG